MKWLNQRSNDQLKSLFHDTSAKEQEKVTFLTSSSDWGVVRNGGRRGQAYGPQALLSSFKKMAISSHQWSYQINEIANQSFEQENFKVAQEKEASLIQRFQNNQGPLIHLGGGHDHIYPFIKGLTPKKFHIINIDAHLDTRTDKEAHSGTPFRQLSEYFKDNMRLTQLGIHPFANAPSNYDKLSSKHQIFTTTELQKDTDTLNSKETYKWCEENLSPLDSDEVQILSLDVDALDAQIMQAVSAVNHQGLKLSFIQDVFNFYQATIDPKDWRVGIYEYNPLFDDLSQKGSRAISSLLYNFLYLKRDSL